MKELLPFAILYEEDAFGPISQPAFSPQGLLAVAGEGADVWDLSGQEVPASPLAYFPGTLFSPIAWSADGSYLATGQERRVVIYDRTTWQERAAHLHDGEVALIAWSPNGKRVVSCSEYEQCHVWQAETGATTIEHPMRLPPMFLLWLPDGRLLTNPFQLHPKSARWQVQIWQDERAEIASLLDDGARRCDPYTRAAFAPGSAHLALGTQEGYVQLWRIPTGATPICLLVVPFHVNTITGLAWAPDEKLLASGSADGHVAIWDEQGEMRYHIGYRPSGERGVRALAWWRDLLAVAYDEGQVGLYRVPETGGAHERKDTHPSLSPRSQRTHAGDPVSL